MRHADSDVLLSIVVPLFNEESNISSFYAKLQQIEEQLKPANVEIIFVDDCSQDRTANLVRDLCKKVGNVRLVRLAKNSGSHAAIMAGITCSQGNCVMFLAGDLQDPPELIPNMLQQWQNGYNIVWAAQTNAQKSLFSDLYWLIVHYFTQLPIPKTGVDFFLIDSQVANIVASRRDCRAQIFLLVADTSFKTTVVPFTKGKRLGGKSGWTLQKKLSLVLETLVFTPFALRIFSVAGLALIALGAFILGGAALAHVMTGATIDKASLLISALGVFTGLQMTMLGLLAEYLFVKLKETGSVPRFVIAEKINCSPHSALPTDEESWQHYGERVPVLTD